MLKLSEEMNIDSRQASVKLTCLSSGNMLMAQLPTTPGWCLGFRGACPLGQHRKSNQPLAGYKQVNVELQPFLIADLFLLSFYYFSQAATSYS